MSSRASVNQHGGQGREEKLRIADLGLKISDCGLRSEE